MGRKSDARERILMTAAGLFRAQGYGAVGVQEICDTAEVKKGSFYHFFPSKKNLILEIVGMAEAMIDGMFTQVRASGRSPVQQVRMMFEMATAAGRSEVDQTGMVLGCPIGNLSLELASRDAEVRQRLAAVFDLMTRGFRGLLEQALEQGQIAGIDPEISARALVAYFEGAMMLAKTSNDPGEIERLADGALALVGFRAEGNGAQG